MSEGFSLGRERFTWEGEILGYVDGFSPERELARLSENLVTRRTYKHRTDRQPAPTDEPEPTAALNQPESHPQSSSYVAMPTNQMIMDELVSL
ncbi:hypothetical protein Lal_00015101 [Lupinus albus]|nr:hypothetical protein Lal_00015101 [Lupinus albus]